MSTNGAWLPLAARDLCFIDLETSGTDPDFHEILEFAAIRISPDLQVVRGKLERKCIMQFADRAEAKALEVNRYDAREWASASPVRLALVEFTTLLGRASADGADADVVIAGHNVSFDWDFIREGYKREKLTIPPKKYLVDTGSIAWPLLQKGHVDRVQLESLCARYGLANAGQHRAMADVVRTIKLYAKLLGLPAPAGGAL